MQISRIILVSILSILLISPIVNNNVSSSNNSIPFWDEEWAFRQEINLPISTNDSYAKSQPIDLRIIFQDPCWTKNENETSIRACCWDGKKWFELESQIYDLKFNKQDYLQECNIIFIVPEFSFGNEKYYVYYDDEKKPAPNYIDHVKVEDSTYSFSPISGISIQAKYYGIKEDNYYIYCIGQEGNLLNRDFSQIVIKQKKDRKNIDVLDSDQIVSFAFSYYYGDREKDESSSDQLFISKEIITNGNLMVEVGIKSESSKRDIRTTAVYRYYYSPSEEKRLSVRIKHEMLESVVVRGMENIDGRFGMMASFKSKSPVIDMLNVGEIYPFLNYYGENDKVNTYKMNLEPESKKREWITSYKEDADLGEEAWIAYGYGEQGKVSSVIFSSNKDIVKNGTDERDGIQIKIAEKEYFDFLNAEVDYASINFGRNSFETGYSHDLRIPDDLVIMFDAELFTSEKDGYKAVSREARIYQTLVKYRYLSLDAEFEKEQKKHSLTVFTFFGGTRFSYPRLLNLTGKTLPVIWIELTQDDKVIHSGEAKKFIFFRHGARKIFSDIYEGDYLIKVYWKINDSLKFFTGSKKVSIKEYTRVNVFCTWQRTIRVTFNDQKGNCIEGIKVLLLDNDNFIYDKETTDKDGKVTLNAPFSLKNPYILKAIYKNLTVFNENVKNSFRKISLDIDIDLYDLTLEVVDKFNLPPGIDITPKLIKNDNQLDIQFNSIQLNQGRYFFENFSRGNYVIQIAYANLLDEKNIKIPEDGDLINMIFSAEFEISIELYDSRANPIVDEEVHFIVLREGKELCESNEIEFSLPPAIYTINAYKNDKLIGFKEVELTNDRSIKLVTELISPISLIILGIVICYTIAILFLLMKKKISLVTFLKLLAISLIIISLIQPWWTLYGSGVQLNAEKVTEIFLIPQVMTESTTYNERTSYDIAELPDIFVDFLEKIVIIALTICFLLFASFISKRLNKKNYSLILSIIGLILIAAILSTFYLGTSKVTQASIGDVVGNGVLTIKLDKTIQLDATWGFSNGFYLVIISVFILLISIFIEFRELLIKKNKS